MLSLTFTQQACILLLIVNLGSSYLNIIHDCDETFNYWEPTHYLLYKYGLQTWEYSPVYALRSYFYIGLHAIVAFIGAPFVKLGLLVAGLGAEWHKLGTFYLLRGVLGAATALSETVFLRGVYAQFGRAAALLTLVFLAFAPGLFFSSTAFLPSSFCMMCYFFAFGHYFRGNHFSAVIFGAFGVLIGWPFPLIMLLPMALHMMQRHGLKKVVLWGLFAAVMWLVPSAGIDYAFYHKWVLAFLNIFLYNATSDIEGGSQLYGVEPWSFYFLNGFLNFNLVWPLALLSLPLLLLFRRWHVDLAAALPSHLSVLSLCAPLYSWLALMLYLPHKEERFLYVIYPLIALAAALTLLILTALVRVFCHALSNRFKLEVSRKPIDRFAALLQIIAIVVFILFSLARITAVTTAYSAPLQLYTYFPSHFDQLQQQFQQQQFQQQQFQQQQENNQQLQQQQLQQEKDNDEINICVGKEWYRFPSNFFLPDARFRIQFIRSGFTGQLPQPFSTTEAIPANFNNVNREEPSRYVDIDQCHFVVDLDLPEQSEPHYLADTATWKVVAQAAFLDAAHSHPLFRSFYVPFLSASHLNYIPYVILQRQ